jgi:hypothetical protein
MGEKQDLGPAYDYFRDAYERSVLFLDVLRQRGNIYREQQAKEVPHVLEFAGEVVLDGRTLPRPVNYGLVRMEALEGVKTDPAKRPFVVVDPRAGHGPGIGGMKKDSEIGVALQAGHPCYFIGFTPQPMPGQTTEDVWTAEAEFVREVARRHPNSGKPAIIANCQAGWQTMIMAATNPDVPGPLLLAGSPLSYWAGVRGHNPLRYLGGMLGGTWLTSLAGDLGCGKFDGASLVANFEALDPANTVFEKPYNVYANVDTEVERFLDFETWWGSPVLLNAGEMQWIADNLFVGNRLTSGEIRTSAGVQIDLRDVQSPIIVFCSQGDNITPPQQALGWITDLYGSDEDLIANGQTIIYAVHETVGHLGIFVSGKIATREHDEFASAMDMIDMMPPGLYEAVIDDIGDDVANRELIEGHYLFRLVPRTLDDIRAFGGNSPEDDLKFRAVSHVSNINRRLYETYMRPLVQSLTPPAFGDWARSMHPNRMRFAIFSDENPAMRPIGELAGQLRADRKPVAEDNPFLAGQQVWAKTVSSTISAMGSARDAWTEQAFHMFYGSPLLQALVGLGAPGEPDTQRIARDALREQAQAKKREVLEERFEEGSAIEAALRSIVWVKGAEGGADERSFAVIKQLHDAQPPGRPRSMSELKEILRDQAMLVRLDEQRAIKAIPKLLPRDQDDRARTLRAVQRVILAKGELTTEGKSRLAKVEQLFGVKAAAKTPGTAKEKSDVSA